MQLVGFCLVACTKLPHTYPPTHSPRAAPQAIAGVRGPALRALRMLPTSPPATLHALRAAALLLGRDPASLRTWREASKTLLGLKLFDDLAAFDAAAPIEPALWKRWGPGGRLQV